MQKLRKRTWMGRLAAVVMAAAVLVLAGAFVSLADESGDTTRFVSGTKVNGVGVGGLTVDEAKARIEGFYAGEYNLTRCIVVLLVDRLCRVQALADNGTRIVERFLCRTADAVQR